MGVDGCGWVHYLVLPKPWYRLLKDLNPRSYVIRIVTLSFRLPVSKVFILISLDCVGYVCVEG